METLAQPLRPTLRPPGRRRLGSPSARVTALFAAAWLGGCAVGPNFKAPEAPRDAAFAPSGSLPAQTNAAEVAGGQAQRFVDGLIFRASGGPCFNPSS